MEWYYADESGRRYAVTAEDLPGLVAGGRIRLETLVWNETMAGWTIAQVALPNLFPAAPPLLSSAQRRAALNPVDGPFPKPQGTTDTVAVCALVFGILGLPICIPIFSIPAIFCGHIARRRAKEVPGTSGNAGLALAGLITGYIGFACLILILLFYVGMITYAITTEGTGGLETTP